MGVLILYWGTEAARSATLPVSSDQQDEASVTARTTRVLDCLSVSRLSPKAPERSRGERGYRYSNHLQSFKPSLS